MHFAALPIDGAFQLVPEPVRDERGFFARTFCIDEFERHGLVTDFSQSSISMNIRRGTVRGMHYSIAPHAETKVVRCTSGAVHDVIVDLRTQSPTFLKTVSIHLSAQARNGLYIPAGVAHGFQTLRDDTEVLYMIDRPYDAGCARGFRWNDPAFDIVWPEPVSTISDRDVCYDDWIMPPPGKA